MSLNHFSRNSKISWTHSLDNTVLANKNVTPNFNSFCLTDAVFSKMGLDKEWRSISLIRDWNDFEFISSMEHKEYPFYGVQFSIPRKIFSNGSRTRTFLTRLMPSCKPNTSPTFSLARLGRIWINLEMSKIIETFELQFPDDLYRINRLHVPRKLFIQERRG